ncbi:type I-E CRISPR-associated protein Cas6/Cse3/CasE [Psychromicrobium sp. YIM B11713]|uniref:type I-E CRISPR-associated protein Cas6/Cse3/CasE n=1 Tax=Psychromicrobium sp. YIM B11713 TaxID=3145233 RepID=UPI00374F497E
MYLTRFQINRKRPGAYKFLGSPQVMHAAVLGGFPDPSPRESGRILWRIDSWEGKTFLYIVSPEQPDLTHLVEQIGWPTTQSWETKPYGELLSRIQEGEQWAFRLTANPTRSIPHRGVEQQRGKVSAHVTADQQKQWLLDKAEKSGFELLRPAHPASWETDPQSVVLSDRRTLKFKRQGAEVTIATVTYDGALQVTDRDAFVNSLTWGIGRAKGYGCGLLTIAPLNLGKAS